MFWLEMSKDEAHGGGTWGFSKCVWAPTHKNSLKKLKWLYWDNLLNVKKGDFILHLREIDSDMFFIGFSLAVSDGYITEDKPEEPGQWSYSNEFYRVDLVNYQKLPSPIKLEKFFSINKTRLIKHYNKLNKPKNLFYTLQSGRLQCLNGAYFSKLDKNLLSLIFSTNNYCFDFIDSEIPNSVIVNEIVAAVKRRIGHNRFAMYVKLNYNNQCCFPGCSIDNDDFLIASHIDRWADNRKCRGDINNGLCFCVFHDKAFENGYFFIDDNYCIRINNEKIIDHKSYVYQKIELYIGKTIKKGKVAPSLDRLKVHKEKHHIKS